MKENKVYRSKVLLFGEYLVLAKAKALASPLSQFSGKWVWLQEPQKTNPYYEAFLSLLAYFWKEGCDEFLDLSSLERDIRAGLHFESDIKVGYGTGSSGALVAALYDRYSKENDGFKRLDLIREKMIRMESFFHGKSSGVDPLVSYTNKTVLLEGSGEIEIMDLAQKGISALLIDSGKSRSTEALVDIFKAKLEKLEYRQTVIDPLKAYSDQAIDAFLSGDRQTVYNLVKHISALQFDGFQEMILPEFKQAWEASLREDSYGLKLCGAGGGGFYLAFGDEESIRQRFSRYNCIKL